MCSIELVIFWVTFWWVLDSICIQMELVQISRHIFVLEAPRVHFRVKDFFLDLLEAMEFCSKSLTSLESPVLGELWSVRGVHLICVISQKQQGPSRGCSGTDLHVAGFWNPMVMWNWVRTIQSSNFLGLGLPTSIWWVGILDSPARSRWISTTCQTRPWNLRLEKFTWKSRINFQNFGWKIAKVESYPMVSLAFFFSPANRQALPPSDGWFFWILEPRGLGMGPERLGRLGIASACETFLNSGRLKLYFGFFSVLNVQRRLLRNVELCICYIYI